jgi:RNA polymerase sigma factor (sigma-70 family)
MITNTPRLPDVRADTIPPRPVVTPVDDPFARLYRANVDRVFMLALRLSANPQDAADVTAETFVRAWRGLPSFRADSSEFTWLHTLTVRTWRDMLRSRRSKQNELTESALSHDEAEQYQVTAQHSIPEMLDLERAVLALPPGAREVLVLRTISGYSEAEVADQLGISRGTVKSQLHRARQLLLQAMDR